MCKILLPSVPRVQICMFNKIDILQRKLISWSKIWKWFIDLAKKKQSKTRVIAFLETFFLYWLFDDSKIKTWDFWFWACPGLVYNHFCIRILISFRYCYYWKFGIENRYSAEQWAPKEFSYKEIFSPVRFRKILEKIFNNFTKKIILENRDYL